MAVYYNFRIYNSHATFTFGLMSIFTSHFRYFWDVLLPAVERAEHGEISTTVVLITGGDMEG